MKKGLIRITRTFYTLENIGLLSIIFSRFIPFEIERKWHEESFLLYGESAEFEEVKEGEKIPQYDCLFTRHEDGSHTLEFVKCQ